MNANAKAQWVQVKTYEYCYSIAIRGEREGKMEQEGRSKKEGERGRNRVR